MANVVVTDDAYGGLHTTLQSLSRRALPVHVVDSGTLVEGWASVLAVGAASGGTSPLISIGDHLDFDSLGPLPATGDMRVGDTWSLVGWDSGGIAPSALITWDGTTPQLVVGAFGVANTVVRGVSYVYLQTSGANKLRAAPADVTVYVPTLMFGSAVVSPELGHDGNGGETLTVRAQQGASGGAIVVEGGFGTATTGGDAVLRPGNGAVAAGAARIQHANGNDAVLCDTNATHTGGHAIYITGTGLAFFDGTPVSQPAVAGSRGGNAALASLLTTLASMGLITDTTTP